MYDREGHEDLTFFTQRFVHHWYRSAAHLKRDLQRFMLTYRVPLHERPRVTELVLLALPAEERRFTDRDVHSPPSSMALTRT